MRRAAARGAAAIALFAGASLSAMTPLDESLGDLIEFVLLAGAPAQLP